MGYIKGQTKLCMHSKDDLEVWHNLEKGGTWCEGVEVNKVSLKKPSALLSSDSEEEVVRPRKRKKKAVSALERKNERIEDNIRRLHDQHGNNFSKVQYRLWTEMLDIGTYKSYDNLPSVPMFTGVKAGKPNQTTALSQAFTEMASSIASALTDHSSNHTSTPGTPPSSSRHSCASSSPGRLVELRSKYIQQLKELHLLVESLYFSS